MTPETVYIPVSYTHLDVYKRQALKVLAPRFATTTARTNFNQAFGLKILHSDQNNPDSLRRIKCAIYNCHKKF